VVHRAESCAWFYNSLELTKPIGKTDRCYKGTIVERLWPRDMLAACCLVGECSWWCRDSCTHSHKSSKEFEGAVEEFERGSLTIVNARSKDTAAVAITDQKHRWKVALHHRLTTPYGLRIQLERATP
jgi:hypothetical protein